jgi:hypothetical protein
MATEQRQFITANNSLQNLGEGPFERANALGNLSMNKPTVAQMNAAMTEGGEISDNAQNPPEPPFGEHIREAVGAIRRILR